jgi:mRNA interferase YafQ
LRNVLELLVTDALPPRNHGHPLSGEWTDHRDCHLKPDLILMYRKPNADVLQLVRLGSHRQLGL